MAFVAGKRKDFVSKYYSHSLAGFVELFVSIDELQVFFLEDSSPP